MFGSSTISRGCKFSGAEWALAVGVVPAVDAAAEGEGEVSSATLSKSGGVFNEELTERRVEQRLERCMLGTARISEKKYLRILLLVMIWLTQRQSHEVCNINIYAKA